MWADTAQRKRGDKMEHKYQLGFVSHRGVYLLSRRNSERRGGGGRGWRGGGGMNDFFEHLALKAGDFGSWMLIDSS